MRALCVFQALTIAVLCYVLLCVAETRDECLSTLMESETRRNVLYKAYTELQEQHLTLHTEYTAFLRRLR